jgi:hypothetical protein
LPYLEEANREFISYAIKSTTLLPLMVRAHSPGFIAYLSQYSRIQIPNPEYIVDKVELARVYDNQPLKVGGGFGNSEMNRKIEQAAISCITNSYNERGWLVTSVESEKRGFDLLCTKANLQEHVEVKGVQGDFVSFIITDGEVRQSQINENFVLYVVTSALSNPTLHRFAAKEFHEQFALQTIAYRATLKQK